MEREKLESLITGFSYVSPEIKEISIVSSWHILQGSEQNLDPENGTW